MTDLDPAIWENETLGSAAQNENLDRLTRQEIEDRSAKLEGREPREVVAENTYPGYSPKVSEKTGTVPSNHQTVHFADEQQNDVPVDSGPEDETAGGVSEPEGDKDPKIPTEEPTPDENSSTPDDSSEKKVTARGRKSS